MNRKFISLYSMLAAMTLILLACEKDNSLPDNDDPATGKARVRFYNASPNSKPVGVFVNNAKINAATGNAYYTAFPGEYFVVNPGSATLKATDTVSTNPATYFELTQNLEADKYYSLFAIDSFAKLKALFLEDNIVRPDTPNANIRFLNLMPGATGMDVMITKIGATTLATPDTLFKNLAFPAVHNFRPLRQEAYEFKVNFRFGTSSAGTIAVAAISLISGGQYTFVLRGFGGTTGTTIPTVTVSSFRPTY